MGETEYTNKKESDKPGAAETSSQFRHCVRVHRIYPRQGKYFFSGKSLLHTQGHDLIAVPRTAQLVHEVALFAAYPLT